MVVIVVIVSPVGYKTRNKSVSFFLQSTRSNYARTA